MFKGRWTSRSGSPRTAVTCCGFSTPPTREAERVLSVGDALATPESGNALEITSVANTNERRTYVGDAVGPAPVLEPSSRLDDDVDCTMKFEAENFPKG